MALNSIEKLCNQCFKSEKFAEKKILLLIHNRKLQDALEFTKLQPSLISWQAKIMYY
jgi:hypothetical protein